MSKHTNRDNEQSPAVRDAAMQAFRERLFGPVPKQAQQHFIEVLAQLKRMGKDAPEESQQLLSALVDALVEDRRLVAEEEAAQYANFYEVDANGQPVWWEDEAFENLEAYEQWLAELQAFERDKLTIEQEKLAALTGIKRDKLLREQKKLVDDLTAYVEGIVEAIHAQKKNPPGGGGSS